MTRAHLLDKQTKDLRIEIEAFYRLIAVNYQVRDLFLLLPCHSNECINLKSYIIKVEFYYNTATSSGISKNMNSYCPPSSVAHCMKDKLYNVA